MSKEHALSKLFDVMQAELQTARPTADWKRFAVERQLTRARKRARITKSGLQQQAVDAFLRTNELVGNLTVTLDKQVEADARHYITVALERFTSNLSDESVQTTLDLDYIFDNWRFGPGASYGVKGQHTAQKIQQSMTCSAQSAPLVRTLRSRHPYLARFDYENKMDGTTVVRGSRLATVPKNEDTERTIAIEPSGSMALQLAAGRYLEGTLRYLGLDISKQQPKNKEAAKRGSSDGSLATIDLKSASDMISLELVRRLMPKEWVWLLETIRSREIELPDGTWVPLNMISTMGNGFTFPLMTLIITALIYGVRAQQPRSPNLFIDWTNTCVYGDDIIIPTHEYESITKVLESAGLIVNHDKSFCEGPFRESCGGDYYLGEDVTPFYVKSVSTNSEVYVAINQVLEWCEKIGVFLHQTLLLLKSYLPLGKVFLVPEWHNPDQGILTSQCGRTYSYLQIQLHRVSLESDFFAMPLICGGYLSASGPHMFFSPRINTPKVKVRKSRLPRGYLDGWDPGKRSRRSSDQIGAVTTVLFR